MELYQKKCVVPVQTGKRQGIVSGVGFGLSIFFMFCVYACSFYAGAQLVKNGETSISDVFQVSYCPNLDAMSHIEDKVQNCCTYTFTPEKSNLSFLLMSIVTYKA
jgi:hypothetical protein